MNKRYILKESKDIDKLVKARNSVGNKFYCIYYKKENEIKKVAISVSKKVGSSPERNYEKRVVREIIRINQLEKLDGFKILVVIKKEATSISYQEKEKELNHLFNKIYQKEKTQNEPFNKNV